MLPATRLSSLLACAALLVLPGLLAAPAPRDAAGPGADARDGEERSMPTGVFETSVPPREGDRYQSADYRLWVPPGARRLRGVLIKQHGCGEPAARTGLDHANDLQWQALARKHGLALLGTRYLDRGECRDWSDPAGGSERALLTALERLGRESGHPELASAPWVLWGHSGGGWWSVQMMRRRPERVLAAVLRAGGSGDLPEQPDPKLAAIRTLWSAGALDEPLAFEREQREGAAQAVRTYREKYDCQWTLAVDPKANHETGAFRLFALRWLDAVIPRALQTRGGAWTRSRAGDWADAWLGDPRTHAVSSAREYRGDTRESVWLPGEAVARAWREYVTTGTVTDTTPPPAPTRARARRTPAGVEVTWQAEADPESGVKEFRVYRGDRLLGTVSGQTHNYGDAPEPPVLSLRYVDAAPSGAGGYSVTTVNHQGLESRRARAAS